MESLMEDYGDWIWDESEYNFFMSLNDTDKLEYVFDFFNFSDEDYEDEFFEFEPEHELMSQNINVDIVLTDGHLVISCVNEDILNKTIMMLKLDGMVLLLQEVRGDSHVYRYLGNSTPISLN